MKRILTLGLLISLFSCRSIDKITKKERDKVNFPKVAFTSVNILPISFDTILYNQTLLVENGVIKEFGDKDSIEVPEGYHNLDCNGKFIMPGLADMHVHISDDGDLLKFLMSGITVVRQMSDVPWWSKLMGFSDALKLRAKQRQGKIFSPDIYSFGYCLDGKPPVSPMNKKIKDSLSASKEVLRQKKKGYDFIKIYDNLPLSAYSSVIRTAREADIPVGGHVPTTVGLGRMLSDKVISIEHLTGYINNNTGYYIIPEDSISYYLKMTRQSGVFNCPTMVVWENIPPENGFDSLVKEIDYKYVSWHVKWLWKMALPYYYNNSYTDKQNYPKHMLEITRELTGRLYQNGCSLIVGTDANVIGTYPGRSTLRELELFKECGIPEFEILKCATINAAKVLGVEKESGTISKGKKANLIILDRNPRENISNIRTLAYVYNSRFLLSNDFLGKIFNEYY